MQITELETLDYPPLTEDLEEAKAHLDKYGMALIKNVLSSEEVEEMDERLNEQFLGEEKYKVGSKVRGDEGFGIESSEEEKVSRLVWNLINKGDCFIKLIDHPKNSSVNTAHDWRESLSVLYGGTYEWKW